MGINTVHIINQFFEIKAKLSDDVSFSNLERNFNRLNSIFEEAGFIIQDPTNELYNEARTDCEASFVGKIGSKMKIKKTIKPIIYKKEDNNIQLVQKAVVLVENM